MGRGTAGYSPRVTRSRVRLGNFHFRHSKGWQMAQAGPFFASYHPLPNRDKGVSGKQGNSSQERMKDSQLPGRLGLESGPATPQSSVGSDFPVGHMEGYPCLAVSLSFQGEGCLLTIRAPPENSWASISDECGWGCGDQHSCFYRKTSSFTWSAHLRISWVCHF